MGHLPSLGATAQLIRQFTAEEVATFAHLSGDTNPLHFPTDFANNSRYKAPIVHGLLCASLFPTIFGVSLPGSVYVDQTLKFHLPVYFDEMLEAKIEVVKVRKRVNVLICETRLEKQQSGEVVISGQAQVLLPNLNNISGSSFITTQLKT